MRFRKTNEKCSWILLLMFVMLMYLPVGIAGAETIPVTGVTLNNHYLSLTAAGYQSQLIAAITPSNATNQAVTWYTDKPSVATVDQNGIVTPQAGGTANIMVYTQDGGYEDYCRVDVVGSTSPVRVTGVTLNKTSMTLVAGGNTATLTATVFPTNAYNKEVQWSSSNDYIAYVDQNGVVWPNSAGTATITALTVDGDHTATCQVTITNTGNIYVTGIYLDKSSITVNKGASAAITATVVPTNATNKNVAWSTSNAAVATVNNGVVTGVAAGTATITAKTADGGYAASCTVTVTDIVYVTGVKLSQNNLYINVGANATLTATVSPENASNKNVTWSTANSAVATVSNGVVTGAAVGSVKITAKTVDGGYISSCMVNVTDAGIPVTGVVLDQTTLSLSTGATAALTATVAPLNATNKNVTWSTSNSYVATVTNAGVVTAVSVGSANITVTTTDGGYSSSCLVTVSNPSVPVTGVTLSQSTLSLNIGSTATLTAAVAPTNATNKYVNWSTSNPAAATVDNGVVTGVAAGTANIVVATVDGGYTASCTVTVTDPTVPVTGVSLSQNTLALQPGAAATLTAAVSPSNATNKNVTWSTSNSAVATVNNGVVTALAAGTATITVKTADGGYTATCSVTVTAPVVKVTGVSLNKTFTTLKKGNKMTLVATIKPTNATNKNVTWSSSNTSVATVSNTGVVTALKSGTVTIKVKTLDGGYTASCTVWVTLI